MLVPDTGLRSMLPHGPPRASANTDTPDSTQLIRSRKPMSRTDMAVTEKSFKDADGRAPSSGGRSCPASSASLHGTEQGEQMVSTGEACPRLRVQALGTHCGELKQGPSPPPPQDPAIMEGLAPNNPLQECLYFPLPHANDHSVSPPLPPLQPLPHHQDWQAGTVVNNSSSSGASLLELECQLSVSCATSETTVNLSESPFLFFSFVKWG